MQVWVEGFSVFDYHSLASYCGSYDTNTLKEAVEMWIAESPARSKYYDAKSFTYWYRHFFDNETDARKVYG